MSPHLLPAGEARPSGLPAKLPPGPVSRLSRYWGALRLGLPHKTLEGRGVPSRSALPAVLLAAALFSGCATYNTKTQGLGTAWNAGEWQRAAQEAQAGSKDHEGSADALVWRLEEGATLRGAQQFAASNEAFDKAEQRVTEFDKAAEVSVSDEFAASLTNLSYLPYRGYAYDRIMLNTYKALNYLQLGNYDSARVELNRALERQREAVAANAERIERAKQVAQKSSEDASENQSGEHYDVQKGEADPQLQTQLTSAYANVKALRAYSDYVNPFTVFLDGLYCLTRSTGDSDLERARKSFERVAGMVPENAFVAQELELVQKAQNGAPLPALTYVIFETGLAPTRDEIRIDIPLFLVNNEVPYVGAAFPILKPTDVYAPDLTAEGQDVPPTRALVLCSMDSVIATDFDNELPIVITKTLLSAGAKAAAAYGMKEATKDAGIAGLLMQIGTTVYQIAMNQADMRTWTTLPKQFQYVRVSTPADRRITVVSSGRRSTVELLPGTVNVIYVKSTSPFSPLNVSQFILQ